MDYRETQKKILAARALLLEPTTTREKFSHVRALIQGINSTLDAALSRCDHEFSTLEKVYGGAVIDLTVEHLPEITEEEKRRKKALLFFLHHWNQLKSEVVRVQAELDASNKAQTSGEKKSHWARIFNVAKGPLGIITILAVGAALLQTTSVQITVHNNGCSTIQSSASIPIPIPGISLPKGPIPNQASANMTLPPLTVSVDGTQKAIITMKALGFHGSLQLGSDISDVTMDGISLLRKNTDIHLSEKKEHSLVIICK